MALIRPEDHAAINAAVTAAEAGSDGEIATMVARQSDDYADWAVILPALLALAIPIGCAIWPQWWAAVLLRASGEWHGDIGSGTLLTAALAGQILTFAILWLALRWMPLRLALTPGRVKAGRVRREAIRAFKIGIEARTRAATGVVVYLSLAERRAEIVADAAINAKVAADVWGDAMAALLLEVRAGRAADGIAAAVSRIGVILSAHFPRSDDDTNELPDRLIEL